MRDPYSGVVKALYYRPRGCEFESYKLYENIEKMVFILNLHVTNSLQEHQQKQLKKYN